MGLHALLVVVVGWVMIVAGTTGAAGDEGGRYRATVSVDAGRRIGEISPHIYGQYLEHVDAADECIYPSIWDDSHPLADGDGLRGDVMRAVQELGTPVVRWPGGCFADAYVWENGIGPRDRRPTLHYKVWPGAESHQFGTDEFLRWCERVGAAPYVNVNHGSGTLDEALRWLEYCNGGPETEQGRRRVANGRVEPYGVRYWGIGNETWGPWEVGHSDARTYARRLAEWAGAMRERDPSIKILAVGSDAANDPEWDRTVLSEAGHLIDYLTLHVYGYSTGASGGEYEAVAYTPAFLETRMRQMLRTIDKAAAQRAATGPARPVRVSIDEWNIRHYRDGKLVRRDPRQVQDAVFVAGTLNAMVRLSPRVGMANYVFLVNGNATIIVNREQVVKTPLYHVFQAYARRVRGQALEVVYDGPLVTPPMPQVGGPPREGQPHHVPPGYRPEPVAVLDTAASVDGQGTMTVVMVNRHRSDAAEVELKLPRGYGVTRSWTLAHEDLYAANDLANPDRVVPVEREVQGTPLPWTCPPGSVVMLTCRKGN